MALVENRSNSIAPWSPQAMPTPGSAFTVLDRLLEDFAGSGLTSTRLPLNMVETDSHLLLDVALPGVKPEQLDVQVEGRTLTLRGRYTPSDPQGQRHWVRTLPSGEFQYTLTLPVKVETDNVDATLDAGMLHLELPKVAEARTKKIEVKQLKQTSVKTIG